MHENCLRPLGTDAMGLVSLPLGHAPLVARVVPVPRWGVGAGPTCISFAGGGCSGKTHCSTGGRREGYGPPSPRPGAVGMSEIYILEESIELAAVGVPTVALAGAERVRPPAPRSASAPRVA